MEIKIKKKKKSIRLDTKNFKYMYMEGCNILVILVWQHVTQNFFIFLKSLYLSPYSQESDGGAST